MRCYDTFSACQAWNFVVVEYVYLLLPFPSPLPSFLSLVFSFFSFFYSLTVNLTTLRK